jgi:hypothetical protein
MTVYFRYSKVPSLLPFYDGEAGYVKAVITPQIPFDLAYSMTSFKAQVALFNVILSLHRYGTITFHSSFWFISGLSWRT